MELELWDDVRSLERRFDDLFRTFLGPRARVLFPATPAAWRRPWLPATDVFARKDDLVIRLELPGIDPEKDVSVALADGHVVISGERKHHEEVKDQDYYRMEACYGAFERHVPVPEGTDPKKMKAEYRDGVLEIVMPAATTAAMAPKEKAIPIKSVKTAA